MSTDAPKSKRGFIDTWQKKPRNLWAGWLYTCVAPLPNMAAESLPVAAETRPVGSANADVSGASCGRQALVKPIRACQKPMRRLMPVAVIGDRTELAVRHRTLPSLE